MEPQELTNEKNELFESFKRWASRQTKGSTISFVIFCLLAGLFLFSAATGYMNWLPCIVCCIIFLVVGSHGMIWYHKLAKANDAQEFLTIYDKNRKIGNWITLTSILLLLIPVIQLIKSNGIEIGILFAAVLVLCLVARFWKYPYMKSIDRLRELVQQS